MREAQGSPNPWVPGSIADELGGSITMVTHFFHNRSEILDAVTQLMIEDSAAELAGSTTRQTRRRSGCAAS